VSVQGKVLNIAHRGGADLWPENTMAAFAGSLGLKCDGMELDVHLSRDGELVVFHDEALKPELVRGPDGKFLEKTGPLLKDLTVRELHAYDVGALKVGSSYAARHPRQARLEGERIPLLRDVIRLTKAKSRTARLWIELKTSLLEPHKSSSPEALADAAARLVKEEDFVERTTFVAFDWNCLVLAKKKAPGVETRMTTLPQSWFGAGAPPESDHPPPPHVLEIFRALHARGAPWEAGFHGRDHGSLQGAVKAAGGDAWFPNHVDINVETAARTKALGLKLSCWTVNDAAEMRRVVGFGCDAVCTDAPDVLATVLAGLH